MPPIKLTYERFKLADLTSHWAHGDDSFPTKEPGVRAAFHDWICKVFSEFVERTMLGADRHLELRLCYGRGGKSSVTLLRDERGKFQVKRKSNIRTITECSRWREDEKLAYDPGASVEQHLQWLGLVGSCQKKYFLELMDSEGVIVTLINDNQLLGIASYRRK